MYNNLWLLYLIITSAIQKGLPVKGSAPNPWLSPPEPGMYRPAPENTGGTYITFQSLRSTEQGVCTLIYTTPDIY